MTENKVVTKIYNPTPELVEYTTHAITTTITTFILPIILDISGIAAHPGICGVAGLLSIVSCIWRYTRTHEIIANTILPDPNKSIPRNNGSTDPGFR
jgi:hypothetical protein